MLISTPSKVSNNKNNNNSISISSQKKSPNNNSFFSISPIKLYCDNISQINKQNENGWTPIYRSIIANNLDVLKQLLKLGANPNLTNNIGETPVYLSVDIDNYDALIILLKNNADCNISKKDGTTPLHLAAKKKKDKFTNILLKYNANPNLPNKLYSQTPLHLAIINKANEDILLCFKRNKGDFFGIKDKYDKAPFDYAKELNDEKYLDMAKKIFEVKNEIIETNNKVKENEDENIINLNNKNIIDNNDERLLNLNELFQNIDISISNKEKNNEKILNLKEDNKEEYTELSKNDLIEIKADNIKEIIKKEKNDNKCLNECINKDIYNTNIICKNKYSANNSFNKPQIYQPKKSIKNSHIKPSKKLEEYMDNKQDNLNLDKIEKKIKKIHNIKNENHTEPEEEILIDSAKIKNKEILTLKGKEINHNLGMGITVTSTDNNIHKSKTNNHINTSVSNDNHPKLSTLSENEFLKNIIIDTAKKIKKNSNSTNHNHNKNNNLSLDNKSNSLFSPLNSFKSESEQNRNNNINDTFNNINNSKILNLENGMSTLKTYKINNSNEIKENKNGKINDMNPLDMMNQVITTNSNISNDTQEQLLNNNLTNVNNNNIRGDSDIFEYSKSYATNLTNLNNNNTDENTLTNNINNSNKKNDFYKKISYHCIHKNKGNNLINNNNFNCKDNGDENINEDENENEFNEGNEYGNNNDILNEENINSIKYKNLNNNNIRNVSSTYDNSKCNSILTHKNKNNTINENNGEDYSLKNISTSKKNKIDDFNSPMPIPYNNSINNSYNNINSNNNFCSTFKDNYSNIGYMIGNSASNTTNTSSMKKYAKKLSILNELEKSKYNCQYNLNNIFYQKPNSIMPIKTNTSNEVLTNENEQSIKIGSPQNIPNVLSSKLHDWLISCDLLCYYNLLIKNKIYNIEEFIDKIKKNEILISYKSIEDLGIKKPGHIFRFLLKIKIDSGLIAPFIYNVILDKYNRNSLNDIKINSSNNGFGCCCFRDNTLKMDKKSINNNNICNNTYLGDNSNDIFGFLKKLNLFGLKENFIHNGFDQVEFIMIQMFSEYKFNKEILNEYLHIYNEEEKKKVLKNLFEEKKNICNEYSIEYNVDEEKEILTSRIYGNESKQNDICLII